MRNTLTLFLLTCFFFIHAQDRSIPADEVISTNHEITVKGKSVPFKATTGTQPVWNDEEKAIAAVHFTYYERTDIKNKASRPLLISFNGGPGSASVWMHLAYTGPKILKVDDEGFPVQPYGVKDNPNSILDMADIVFVNPVNTGYSRILDTENTERDFFFGVQEDISYLAEWINTFVTRMNRWESPKYLIGESYGTTRVSGLALELQNRQWMYLNGVILVSPTELGIHSGRGRRDGPLGAALRVPYFTAAAWYHKKLPQDLQSKDLLEVLEEVETYSIQELMPILVKGGFVSEMEKKEAARMMARYSGISEKAILQYNLDVPASFFWKELLREEGFTVGRLDSRYKGIDRTEGGDRPDFNSELTSWLHAFTPAINYYYKNVLKYETDMKYNMFGPVHPWNRDGNNTGENLRQAMAQNPYLHTMIQSGYYDGATKYFDAKYTMWQIDPSGKMKDRLSFKGYRSGHMMYLRNEDLISSNDHLREFIQKTLPGNKPAKY
ncbi:Carboxypeptidase C (cathepsin A) [Ekhidna lutea]|uniref:Carboxypeptidase C (Cathepsin A) n=1 Tax=Ekhidna lutea TaxID=447679 RepID=A0A239M003_EKHLU|nr:carboxypeptidase [Ekhidna lutea]SNT35602.1 Carboxypeptidase C (cathepsin A) [Ekhidna lutea]